MYYYSRTSNESKAANKGKNASKQVQDALREEENEKLRQIGLAQGMVGFAQ